jgi:hypothetical protein
MSSKMSSGSVQVQFKDGDAVSLKVTSPPDPPTGKMGGARAPASRAMAAARCCAPLTPAQSRRRSAVRWVGGGSMDLSDSYVTLDLTMPREKDLWVNLLVTVLIKEHQILISLLLRLPQHFHKQSPTSNESQLMDLAGQLQ